VQVQKENCCRGGLLCSNFHCCRTKPLCKFSCGVSWSCL